MALQSSIMTKSIAVLDALGDGNRPQTFSEIVKSTAFNKSTVHRLLSILTTEGLARYDENTKTYMLGNKLLELARKAWRGYDIQALALDEMLRLHDLVRENVSIGVMQGDEVVHLRMIESQFHWGIVHPPVMREPMHSTATGKALLAFLPLQILSACLDKQEFPRSHGADDHLARSLRKRTQEGARNGLCHDRPGADGLCRGNRRTGFQFSRRAHCRAEHLGAHQPMLPSRPAPLVRCFDGVSGPDLGADRGKSRRRWQGGFRCRAP